MWPSQQPPNLYQYQHQQPPPPQPPPLAIPSNMPPQNTYNMHVSVANEVPPSPRSETENEEARLNALLAIPTPTPICTVYNGVIYALEFVQQPVRARMCGFGDKDRRPITPPPCIRVMMLDAATQEELDSGGVDLSFFVVTIDLYDMSGKKEVNLVKHAQSSPSISTASTGAYPPTIANPPSSHTVPQSYNPESIPGYTNSNSTSTNVSPYGYYNNSNGGGANGGANGHVNGVADGQRSQMYPSGQQQLSDSRYQNGQPNTNGNNYTIPSFNTLPNSQDCIPYPTERHIADRNSSNELISPQTAGMYTRNLIGSSTGNAFLLKDENGKPGPWFVMHDLSVRTEGIFRLKASFFNIGQPKMNSGGEAAFSSSDGNQAQELTKSTAPLLAMVFSAPFQVFSAKKFPGVIESTPLSRSFAQQGIKIPIRKDPNGNEKKSRRRGSNDEDEEDVYDEE